MSHLTMDWLSQLELVPCEYISDLTDCPRSLYERLFTRPWTPWIKIKSIYTPRLYICEDGSILVSYKTYELVMEQKMLNDNQNKRHDV